MATGTLTNMALEIQRDPGFATHTVGIAVVGAKADQRHEQPPDYVDVYADPQAAEIVLDSGAAS